MKQKCVKENHCWHLIDMRVLTNNTTYYHMCCHCGVQQETQIDTQSFNKMIEYNPQEHGKYWQTTLMN